MEQHKRKIPPRAAARAEQAAKRLALETPTEKPTPSRSAPAVSKAAADKDHKVTPGKSKSAATKVQRSQLPRSITAAKPLPSVEIIQPEDLSTVEYQTIQESGVLAEALSRSRSKWINEGIFEKYWSKPSKRRGVATDDPKNPPKDSMVRLGQVLITVEPHILEATMYGVRDPKQAAMLPPNRPVLMYGPTGGAMPPPGATPPPKQKKPRQIKQLSQSPAPQSPMHAGLPLPATPGHKTIPMATPSSSPQTPLQPLQPQKPLQSLPPRQLQPPQQCEPLSPAPTISPVPLPPLASTRELAWTPPVSVTRKEASPVPIMANASRPVVQPSVPATSSVLRPPVVTQRPPPLTTSQPRTIQPPPSWPSQQPMPATVGAKSKPPSSSMSPAPGQHPAGASTAPVVRSAPVNPSPGAVRAPAPAPPPGTDSIIVTLAERASHDADLREMMKRVANGQAPKDELDRFQSIINQITEENKNKGTVDGPSADRLFVNGRTVRFFAEEVRIILDVVLRSNPTQKAFNLVPPQGSDPLVVLLVKKCLDDTSVRDMVRRIAENTARYSDAIDLKNELEKFRTYLEAQAEADKRRQADIVPAVSAAPAKKSVEAAAPTEIPSPKVNGSGAVNGVHTPVKAAPAAVPQDHSSTLPVTHPKSIQAQKVPAKETAVRESGPTLQPLRSKAPPPAPKLLDVSAVVFEFAGGTGDRYMFPKFSIVEYATVPHCPPEAIASFLIVRKGSASEYDGDPDLDYYQPITVRLQVSPLSSSPKLLDYLAKVVAPVDEVARYMEKIMHSMTRAEFVQLAMRLPRRKSNAGGGVRGKASGLLTSDDESDDAAAKKGAIDDTLDTSRKKVTPGINGDAGEENERYVLSHPEPLQGVLWATKAARPPMRTTQSALSPACTIGRQAVLDEDDQYQSFIAGLIPKEVEEEA
ncbi:hypothetical protein SEPCBS119000_003642 [Sporothrix epigloea]|uniref:SWR1-complex protein 3 domain-containing protein n=1 Tax=Sporothrix epigloea TaxID=1892477 RepID=A0ABP0DMS1_9PEZI